MQSKKTFGNHLENGILNLYILVIVIDFLINDKIPDSIQSVL